MVVFAHAFSNSPWKTPQILTSNLVNLEHFSPWPGAQNFQGSVSSLVMHIPNRVGYEWRMDVELVDV